MLHTPLHYTATYDRSHTAAPPQHYKVLLSMTEFAISR